MTKQSLFFILTMRLLRFARKDETLSLFLGYNGKWKSRYPNISKVLSLHSPYSKCEIDSSSHQKKRYNLTSRRINRLLHVNIY